MNFGADGRGDGGDLVFWFFFLGLILPPLMTVGKSMNITWEGCMDGKARGAAADVGLEGVRDLDHRAERVGEVDAGVHFGPRADAAGEAELRVGRGQCAARAEQQPGIQRRSRTAPRTSGGWAKWRSYSPTRALSALPASSPRTRRTATRAGSSWRPGTSSRYSWTWPWRSVSNRTPKGCTSLRGRGRSRGSRG
jgi:hypothetical protein